MCPKLCVRTSSTEVYRYVDWLNGECLTVKPELEVWISPLADGSLVVLLFNLGDSGSEPITGNWSDVGFPVRDAAVVCDSWARENIAAFRDNYKSFNIDAHAVMMFKLLLINRRKTWAFDLPIFSIKYFVIRYSHVIKPIKCK